MESIERAWERKQGEKSVEKLLASVVEKSDFLASLKHCAFLKSFLKCLPHI